MSHQFWQDGTMQTSVQLDYHAILANSSQPVHLVLNFTAPAVGAARDHAIALSLVIDRSGSMSGEPLAAAKKAAQAVVKNLRAGDSFGLVTFDDTAEVVIPMGQVTRKQEAYAIIDRISPGGSTNLTGGWMLGRDALRESPPQSIRRLLLLTDGQMNVGVVDPGRVKQSVSDGWESSHIRTSTLGFGDGYAEDLLADLAGATGGAFYDANSADQLPAIFAAELDGLQQIAVQNLRVRIKPLDFVDGLTSLGGYQAVTLPDGRREFAIGDLTAEEERVAVFALAVLPIPLLAGSDEPAANLDGETLVELELLYDEFGANGVRSVTEAHTVRVRPTQSPADVRVNEAVLSWVSAQQSAEILARALVRRDSGDVAGASAILREGLQRLQTYQRDAQMADGLMLLETALKDLQDADDYSRSRKKLQGMRTAYMKMSSSAHWAAESPAPSFSKRRPPPNP
jgi:Ca-activated chloride channel homolog